MNIRTAFLVGGLLVALAGPTTAEAEMRAGTEPVRRLPIDAGTADALLPPTPRPLVTSFATDNEVDRQKYEAREQSARHLEQFRGGEGVSIYIGGGVLTAVVLVALIVILL